MNIGQIDLLSLQTSYMQKDAFVQALCKALNPYFQQLSDSVKVVYIYGRIDELDEEAIDSLAWQFHVDFYDYTLPIEKKRALVKQSKILHKIKGTPEAVERAVTTIFGRTKLKEWFEYGGKPYFFGLDIDVTECGASQEQFVKLDRLIEEYKNKRSWIDYININLTTIGNVKIAATAMEGEEIIVYPWMPKEINQKGNIKIPIAQNAMHEEIIIYPKEEA